MTDIPPGFIQRQDGTEVDASDLIIHRVLNPDQDPQNFNFKLLTGIVPELWIFERGAKNFRDYKLDGDLAVKVVWDYTLKNGNRDIDSYVRKLQWFSEDGNIAIEKTLPSNETAKKMKEINRAIRQARIDFLEAAAEELRDLADTVPEPYKTQ